MRLFATLLLTAALALPALAQDPAPIPAHFAGGGLGFQGSSVAHSSGWLDICTMTVPRTYGCVRTDYAGGGVTSTRAEAHPVIWDYKQRLFLLGTVGAGIATGPSAGLGGSFDAGGVMAFKLPASLGGWYAVGSGSWQKNNVLQAPDVGSALKVFGSQTVWRFGFGKGW